MTPPPEPAASDSSPHRSTTWRSFYGRLPLASTHGGGDCLAWLTCDGGSCPSLSASGGVEVLSSITTAWPLQQPGSGGASLLRHAKPWGNVIFYEACAPSAPTQREGI